MRGFGPAREVLLFRQKDPKPWAPGRGPPGAFAPVPKFRAAELASLRQSSPPNRVRDWGAATPAGALGWRHVMARVRRQRPNTTTNYNDGIPSFERLRTGASLGMTIPLTLCKPDMVCKINRTQERTGAG